MVSMLEFPCRFPLEFAFLICMYFYRLISQDSLEVSEAGIGGLPRSCLGIP